MKPRRLAVLHDLAILTKLCTGLPILLGKPCKFLRHSNEVRGSISVFELSRGDADVVTAAPARACELTNKRSKEERMVIGGARTGA